MTNNKEFVDVAIIGASLAGSAAAIELGKRGVRVALLDAASFPRRKACGEGLSHLARPYLECLGIASHELLDDKNEFFGYRFVAVTSGASPHRAYTVRANHVHGWGVSRSQLDTLLVQKTHEYSSVTTFFNEKVRGIKRKDSWWEVISHSRRIRSGFIIVATGANLRSLCGAYVSSSPEHSHRVGVSFGGNLLSGDLGQMVTIIPSRLGELYVTSLGDHRVNVSAVGEREFVQQHRAPIEISETLRRTLGIEVELESDSKGAAHFSSRRQSNDPHLYLVGDALETFDPACGLGMTHAVSSALLASTLIHSVLTGSRTALAAHREYQARHCTLAAGIRRFSWFVRVCMTTFQAAPRLFSLLPSRFAMRCFGVAQLLARQLQFDKRFLLLPK